VAQWFHNSRKGVTRFLQPISSCVLSASEVLCSARAMQRVNVLHERGQPHGEIQADGLPNGKLFLR